MTEWKTPGLLFSAPRFETEQHLHRPRWSLTHWWFRFGSCARRESRDADDQLWFVLHCDRQTDLFLDLFSLHPMVSSPGIDASEWHLFRVDGYVVGRLYSGRADLRSTVISRSTSHGSTAFDRRTSLWNIGFPLSSAQTSLSEYQWEIFESPSSNTEQMSQWIPDGILFGWFEHLRSRSG